MKKKKIKAIALISGGLDSLLAARMIKEQGIDVKGVVFVMQFASKDTALFKKNVRSAARQAEIAVKFVDISEEFLKVLGAPGHGYGANVNPCIDCKILMLSEAKKIKEEQGADFIITGEVLGERPMSQRKEALNIIERSAGLKGFLLRPLSAKILKETVPEREKKVERTRLGAMQGRSRKPQLALAKKYGIKTFFSPAGGCLLTEKLFAVKLKDLMLFSELTSEEAELLKYGRHFRLDNKTKAVIGRDEKDNAKLVSLKREGDLILRIREKAGPYALLRGNISEENIRTCAGLVVAHSKSRKNESETVEYWQDKKGKALSRLDVSPVSADRAEELRI